MEIRKAWRRLDRSQQVAATLLDHPDGILERLPCLEDSSNGFHRAKKRRCGLLDSPSGAPR
jgi:hypothetical protein